jgi:NADH-quinone oxidoreductase subunit L
MISSVLAWIVLFPFLGALVMGLVYLSASSKRTLRPFYVAVGVGFPILATVLGFWVIGDLFSLPQDGSVTSHLFRWISIGSFDIDLAFVVDRLSAVMLLVVTFVGSLIHIYAVGYMWEDEGFGKFFAYFNFFLGSMLVLVLANNPIILFIGWELVGLASYLLIGYYHQDPANIKAANKAFILNRVGDFGFVSGLGLLFVLQKGSGFDFASIFASLSTIDPAMLSLIGLLLFVGAMGKSAQIPLYVWLPDAMAGPTPVSALIHAATMVTAGVYMVARFAPLYNLIPDIGLFIATIGAASALLAALFASYQNDIKKILAYSTMSQLGYMFIAVGLGAYSNGIFHLFGHAFFKALLFMGAGAVIVALHHEQNIFKMGALHTKMKGVSIMMFIATLAISGIPIFTGFFSKDAILSHAYASGHTLIWGVGVASAFLTAYYMFRLYFVVFLAPSNTTHTPQKLPTSMIWPLGILALGSAFLGFFNLPEAYGGGDWFSHLLHLPDTQVPLTHAHEYWLDGFNVAIAILGIYVAYRRFVRPARAPQAPVYLFAWQKLLANTLHIDTLYDYLIVQPLRGLSRFFERAVDNTLIDGAIQAAVRTYLLFADRFAWLQNGLMRWYALYILLGISGVSLYLIVAAGGV